MFVDVHAFWLARRLSDGVQCMSDGEILSYEQVYLWKRHNEEPMTMVRLDFKQEVQKKFDTMLNMRQIGEYYEFRKAEAAYIAWLSHNIPDFTRNKDMVDMMIFSLGLRKKKNSHMTQDMRKKINDIFIKWTRKKAVKKIQSFWRRFKTLTENPRKRMRIS